MTSVTRCFARPSVYVPAVCVISTKMIAFSRYLVRNCVVHFRVPLNFSRANCFDFLTGQPSAIFFVLSDHHTISVSVYLGFIKFNSRVFDQALLSDSRTMFVSLRPINMISDRSSYLSKLVFIVDRTVFVPLYERLCILFVDRKDSPETE